MAQYSMSTVAVQRSSGSSAVAHAAYVSGSALMDERTGHQSDYTRRSGVECAAPAIVVPAAERQTQSAAIDRGQLWNQAERCEKRKDGRPARKVLVALPHELSSEQRHGAVQEYAQWLADRFGVAVDYAIHAPDKEGDKRNYHAHIVVTTREIHDGQLTTKSQLEWEDKKLKAAGLNTGKAMVVEMREAWESVHNRALQQHKPDVEPVSCRTLKAQREAKIEEAARLAGQGRLEEANNAQDSADELDRTPQDHVGWQATEMSRRGIQTELSDMRRAAQAEHQSLITKIRTRLRLVWETGKAAIAKITQPRQKPASPASDPEVEWMRRYYPQVFDLTPRQAQQWCQAQIDRYELTEADRERPGAWEMFLRDTDNPALRAYQEAHAALKPLQQKDESLRWQIEAEGQKGGLLGRAGSFLMLNKRNNALQEELYNNYEQLLSRTQMIEGLKEEWEAPGSPLRGHYEAAAKAEAERLDKQIAEKNHERGLWEKRTPKVMEAVRARQAQANEHERRQSAPKGSSVPVSRSTDPEQCHEAELQLPGEDKAAPPNPKIAELKKLSAELGEFRESIAQGESFQFQHLHAEFLLDAVCGAPQGREYLNRIAETVAHGQVRNEPLYHFGVLKIRRDQDGQLSYAVAPDPTYLTHVGIHFQNASALAHNDSMILGRPPTQSNDLTSDLGKTHTQDNDLGL